MMLGAAIFANPKAYNPGQLNDGCRAIGRSSNGGDTQRISGTGELASNVKWISNIGVDTAYGVQLKNTPKLLDDKYLRTAVSSIILELGLKAETLEKKSEVISSIFNNVIDLSRSILSIEEIPKGSLSSGIATKLGHYHQKVLDHSISEASMLSCLPFTNCERENIANRDVEFVSLVLPRVNHAEHILAKGLPWDELIWLTDDQIPSAADRVKWICNSHLPMLAEVEIPSISAEYNSLINWGNGAGSIRRSSSFDTANPRAFITSNELKVLSEFSNLRVKRIALCNSQAECRYDLPSVQPMAKVSYSYGLFAENFWCALLRDRDGLAKKTFMSSWIHAEDRMRCMRHAKALKDKGFIVNGYGYGRITLAVDRDAKQDLKKEALSLGLLPYLDIALSIDAVDMTSVDTPEQMNSLLYASGLLAEIQYLDNMFVDEVVK